MPYIHVRVKKESDLLKLTFDNGSYDVSEAESYDSRAVFGHQQEEAADKFRVRDISSCR